MRATDSQTRSAWLGRHRTGLIAGSMLAACAAMLAASVLVSCGGLRARDTEIIVVSFAPHRTTDEARAPITLRFSRPIVTTARVGKPIEQPPIVVSPPIRTAAHWADRQTLVLAPREGYRRATRYAVSLAGDLAERASPKHFTFVHRPLRVLALSGLDPEAMAPRPSMTLDFDQPVDPAEVAAGCRLRTSAGAEVALAAVAPQTRARSVTLAPRQALLQAVTYSLRCAGFSGVGGNVPLPAPYERELTTHPPLSVVSTMPRGSDVSATELRIQVVFSTPVRLEDVRRHLRIRPTARGFAKGWLDRTGTRYATQVDLRVSTQYSVRIDPELVDVHGQRLARPVAFSFRTGDASPQLSLERGIYAVEAARAGYPVWARNVRRLEVTCAQVPRDRVAQLLTSGIDYDPWFDTANQESRVDFGKLGLAPRRSELPLPATRNKWQLRQLPLATLCRADGAKGRRRGLFLAELRASEVEQSLRQRARDEGYGYYRYPFRVLANVTDLGVLLKAGTASGILWVTRLSDGEPAAGARVALLSPQGKRVFRGVTGSDGLLRLPGTSKLLGGRNAREGDHESQRAQRMIAIVEKGDDLAVLDGNWDSGIQSWNFGVPVDRAGGVARIRGFIQSDRGIYRPGARVRFKGLVREIRVGQLPRVPRQRTIRIEVRDPRDAVIYRGRPLLSSFGGFAFEHALAEEARLGDYQVTAELGGQTFRERFQVEAFRKVAFEVTSEQPRHARRGARLTARVSARYLFGAPVKDAAVRWRVQRRPHVLRFASLAQYAFSDEAARGFEPHFDERDGGYPVMIAEGEGRTDERGRFALRFSDPKRRLSGPQDYLVQVTVTDETDQSVSRRVVITGHRTAHYLGLHPQEVVQAVNMPFSVNAVARAPDGGRVTARARLSLIRERTLCPGVSGRGATQGACRMAHEQVWSRQLAIPATGVSTQRVVPRAPGEYILRLQGTDARGRAVVASRHVWVLGPGQAFWSGDESARMALIPSKREYQVGETARLVPRARMGHATALVTLERNGILDARVLRLRSASEGISVPIVAAHAPNVFASVALVSGRSGEGDANRPRFKLGVTDLRVSPQRARLHVSISTEQPRYEPGAQVRGRLRVTDARGRPVRAEVSLSAADEGVLQLIAYETPDPLRAFYAPWGLGVASSTTLNRLARLNDPSALELMEEGGDGGRAGGGARARSRFVSSAFWAPALLTDERGEARFAFEAPDSLTAFRLMAAAADRGSRFGAAEARITIAKPLLVRPVLPRFVSVGDALQVGVMVHNYTARAGDVTVLARGTGLRLERRRRTVRVAAGGSARLSFDGAVRFAREASLLFSARLGDAHDAVRVALPVVRPVTHERYTVARGTAESRTVEIPLDEITARGLLASESQLEITADRLGLAELEQSLRYLIEYPHGCLEQTLSRLIPLTKVEDLARSLKLDALRGARLRGFINAGVAKVGRHQHADGHFSLWPSGPTYPHLTAYALYGLHEARRAGVTVDRAALRRGARALRRWAQSGERTIAPGGESATMAMAAYVLAQLGQPAPGLNARLFEARQALPRYGQAFLLRALRAARAPTEQQRTLLAELRAAVSERGETAAVQERAHADLRPLLVHYMGSDVRSSAIVLSALLEADVRSPLIPRLAEGLKAAQRPTGRWYNTQDNLYALVALADYARQQQRGSSQVAIYQGQRRLARARLHGGAVFRMSRPLSRLGPQPLRLRVRGRVRYAVRLRLARRVRAAQPPVTDRGLQVTREYHAVDTGAAVSEVGAGQLVRVRLEVTTDTARHYVALVDPLPAGLEPVNSKLATEEQRRGAPAPRPWYGRPTWTHTELHDARATAFADRLPAGTTVLEYTARATIPGRFVAAPAFAEAMYDPDVRGRSAAARFAVLR